MEAPVAVVVRNAEKGYPMEGKVLCGLNMTIPHGAIYALLGPSGGGKSTLISCILGIRKLDRGQIHLYGEDVGISSRDTVQILGRNVGYMPQNISLHLEFTLGEMLTYFGVLGGITAQQLDMVESIESLTSLLKLPEPWRPLSSLSGGQLRRVSLACALIHKPKLIVLDEPTVGVDPVMRERIWSHLKKLASSKSATILMTSHYLEEARHADRIGVMHGGKMLVENSPQVLLSSAQTSSIDSAVLNAHKTIKMNEEYELHQTPSLEIVVIVGGSTGIQVEKNNQFQDWIYRMMALLHLNFAAYWKNLFLTVFTIFVPSIFISSMCLTAGKLPSDIPIGVVNYELGLEGVQTCSAFDQSMDNLEWSIAEKNQSNTLECDSKLLSCYFLETIPKETLKLIQYQSEFTAMNAVKEGSIWGVLSFPSNFSPTFVDRGLLGIGVDENVLISSSITLRLDSSNKLVQVAIVTTLLKSLVDFGGDLLESCGFLRKAAKYSLDFKKPIFGPDELNFLSYTVVGLGVSAVFFFPIISTGIRLIHERQSGMLERSLVSGVRLWEFLLAHAVSESVILVLGILLQYFVLVYVFNIRNEGSFYSAFGILFLVGYTGISLGFLVSRFREKIDVALMAIALLLPNMFLSGCMWSTESLPSSIQNIVPYLPCTLPGESMRSIFNRGWPITHPHVWPGFVILLFYIPGINILNAYCHTFLSLE